LSDRRLFSARTLLPTGYMWFAMWLGLSGAASAPDAGFYRLLALGQRAAVPAPFSARILGPAIAGWLGRITGLGVDAGFLFLGVLCLVGFFALIEGLLWSWRAPTAIFAAIFLMPFWVDIFHDYYLPDLLHGAILAAILSCFWFGYTAAGMVLLFPAYLARESTLLVALCLLFACWRRVRLHHAVIGALAIVCAGLVSRHYGQGGPASVHGLGGGVYILGKLFWSFFKNVLGLPLWSNTLPECNPIWNKALPGARHFGAIREVGLCQPSLWGPARLLMAWFGIFGIGPSLALALWRKMISPPRATDLRFPGQPIVFRFCLLYGIISILMTPLLGASADRLVEYGWPFYFVVLPWFVAATYDLSGLPTYAMVLLHLLTCWLAWFGFREQTPGYLFTGLAVLGLNGVNYVLLSRFGAARPRHSQQ
jgi:hypothetical protein